jgi:hypothetical protein
MGINEPRDFEVNLPHDYLSATQIGVYMSCPRRYYYRYILDRSTTSSSSLVMGRLIHKVIELTLRDYIELDFEVPSAEFMQDTLSDEFADHVKQIDEWVNKYQDHGNPAPAFESEARELAELYRRERIGKLRPRMVEHKFRTVIGDKVPFVGYIDIIDRDLELEEAYKVGASKEAQRTDAIRDIKVVGKKYGQHRVMNSLQLSLYAGAMGVYRVGFDLVVRSTGSSRSKHRIVAQPEDTDDHVNVRSVEEIVWAQEVALDVAEAISKDHFPRCEPEMWVCSEKWCDHYSECRGKKR